MTKRRAAREVPVVAPHVRAGFGRELRSWYRRNGRDLPWRRTRDPYQVLVSELMLQQTQVSRVVPHYLPGTNKELTAYANYYKVPYEATKGGAETMYPEYWKKLKQMMAVQTSHASQK